MKSKRNALTLAAAIAFASILAGCATEINQASRPIDSMSAADALMRVRTDIKQVWKPGRMSGRFFSPKPLEGDDDLIGHLYDVLSIGEEGISYGYDRNIYHVDQMHNGFAIRGHYEQVYSSKGQILFAQVCRMEMRRDDKDIFLYDSKGSLLLGIEASHLRFAYGEYISFRDFSSSRKLSKQVLSELLILCPNVK